MPLLLALAAAPLVAQTPAATEEAPRIQSVEVRLDAPLGRPLDLTRELAIAPGGTLTSEAVRRTLLNLYATGLIADAEVRARPTAGGVVAVVVARGHTWVDSVELSGVLGLPRTVLARSIEQRAGTPLVEGRLLRSVYALQDLYARRGYRDAHVTLDVVQHPGSKRVDVVFHLASGPRATIGKVFVVGSTAPFDAAALAAVVTPPPATGYSAERVRADVERLRGWLVERDYLQAEVDRPTESYEPATHRIDLSYPVTVGPEVEIEVHGADRRRLVKAGLLPFSRERTYDQALVTQSCERIRTSYQRRGHYHATVDCQQAATEGHITLDVTIEPGPRAKLTEIRFEGNHHFTDAELAEHMTTSTPRLFSPGSGALVTADLDADLSNLRAFYLLRGFPQVAVGPPRVEEHDGEVRLVIPIEEGPRQRVVEITLSGVEHFTPDELLGRLPLAAGGPYHRVLLEDAVNLLRALYEEEGYLSTSVEPTLDWNDDHTLVDVHLAVAEGPQTLVDRIVLSGLQHTRSDVLRRFVRLHPGDPVSRRRLLEVERDLYRLGIFSSVDVELAPSSEALGRRNVRVRVVEGSRWRLGYGVSYHSDDGPGGLLSLSRANLGGTASRLQLDLRANERDQRYRLLLDQPTLGRFRIPITYTLFRQQEKRESLTVDDTGAQVALTKDLPRVRIGLTYDLRRRELSGELIDLAELPPEDRKLNISSLTPTFLIDRRDDPIDATRGWSSALQLEYAFPFFHTDAEFAKLFLQQSRYLPLGRFGVLAGSLRLGAIEPLDGGVEPDPLLPDDLPNRLIPPSERFFAGGRTTHRAYERDQLGIPGQTLLEVEGRTIAAGGNGLLLLNLDYRFPITGSFGGTVFADVGNVWADWRQVDPRDAKPGIGLGVRYRSPIGPVRLEIGWKLEPEPGESNPVFFLSFGNPF